MWLHIPDTVTASPSAQEQGDSNSDCICCCPDTALFAGSSATHTLRPLSWPGWRTRRWMTRLSGLTCAPSTAERGVARWISSLPVTRASHSAQPDCAVAPKTPGTSGPKSPASSGRRPPRCSSPRTSSDTSPSASTRSAKSYKLWATTLQQASTARQRSAHRTSGRDSSYWPTPTVSTSGAWPDITLRQGRLVMRGGASQLGIHMATKAWTLLFLMGVTSPRACSLPIPMRLTPGNAPSEHPLVCNPRFLEALMGWPTGWTDTDSPVTGFALWQQRMRSALSQLPYADPHPMTDGTE